MDVYLDGSTVTLDVPFEDRHGNPVTATSASYRVLAEDNSVLIDTTSVSVAGGVTEASITVDAAFNTLAAETKRALRVVELTLETSAGTVVTSTRYIIEASAILDFGVTSFQTFNEAVLMAEYMVDVDMWKSSDDTQQRAALMEAYRNLMRLNYVIDDQVYQQSSLFYDQRYRRTRNISLKDLTPAEMLQLPDELIEALKRAQVAEADFLLGGETVGDKRRIGLLSESVGESSQMFRTGKPLKLPVSEKALGYLSGQITWSVGVRR